MAGKTGKRKRRIGYEGCGLDFVVFTILFALACWGIGHWNGLARRPFGWGRVPIPSPVRTIERMIGYTRHHGGKSAPTPAPSASAAGTPTPASSATPPPAAPATPAPATPVPAATPTPDLWATPSASATPAAVPTPAPVRVAAAITAAKADVHASPDPLSAPATMVATRGTTLYSGLTDGGITIRDTAASGKGGTVVRPAGAAGAVTVLFPADDGGVWWMAGEGASRHIFHYAPASKQVRTVDLSPLGPGAGAPTTLAVVAGPGKAQTLVLSTAGGSAPLLLDTATGAQREASAVFPADIAAALARPATTTFLSPRNSDGRQTLVTLSGDGVAPGAPPAVSVWTGDGWGWHPRSFDVASASLPAYNTLRLNEPGGAGVSVTPEGVALLAHASGGQTLASAKIAAIDLSGTGPAAAHALQTLPDGVFGLWAASDCIARGPSGVWWSFSGTVFHTAKSDGSGSTESFLPWNGAGDEKHGHVSAICVDGSGAWVATDTGVHHIVPGHPNPSVGYGGYLRAALGADAARVPSAPVPQKLNTLASQWSGVPYKLGGNDKTGIDCSGYLYTLFSNVGVSVPRSTAELASASAGKRIKDDLRFGDVLVYPGHCAMYLGNGWTTEAIHPTVSKAAIWSRRSVVVKRFLK